MNSYSDTWANMMQPWLNLWNIWPGLQTGLVPTGIAPHIQVATSGMGHTTAVGDVSDTTGLAVGQSAQARVETALVPPGVVSGAHLDALTLQIAELTRQIAALTAQCAELDAHLAELAPVTRKEQVVDAGSP